MTVREFIKGFNIIDRNVYIYPKTKKDLTNTDGDKSKYILAIYKPNKEKCLEKTYNKYKKRLRMPDITRLKTLSNLDYSLSDLLNAKVWRVSTDCSWYDRVPPICLYIEDIELISKSEARKNKKLQKQADYEKLEKEAKAEDKADVKKRVVDNVDNSVDNDKDSSKDTKVNAINNKSSKTEDKQK